jgi:hypothetical protein
MVLPIQAQGTAKLLADMAETEEGLGGFGAGDQAVGT